MKGVGKMFPVAVSHPLADLRYGNPSLPQKRLRLLYTDPGEIFGKALPGFPFKQHTEIIDAEADIVAHRLQGDGLLKMLHHILFGYADRACRLAAAQDVYKRQSGPHGYSNL